MNPTINAAEVMNTGRFTLGNIQNRSCGLMPDIVRPPSDVVRTQRPAPPVVHIYLTAGTCVMRDIS
jgi:hypothetical protein